MSPENDWPDNLCDLIAFLVNLASQIQTLLNVGLLVVNPAFHGHGDLDVGPLHLSVQIVDFFLDTLYILYDLINSFSKLHFGQC